MCRAVHVNLSAEDEKAVRKIYGVLIPAVASVALVLFAAAMFAPQSKQGELVASAQPAAKR